MCRMFACVRKIYMCGVSICLNVATRYTNLFRHPSGTGWWARCVWHRVCSEILRGLLVSGVVVVWVVAHLTPTQRSTAVGLWAMFRPYCVRRGASIQPFCSQVSCHEWWSMCTALHPIKFDTKFVFSRFVSCDTCLWFCCVVRVGVGRWIVCRSGSRRVSLCERMQFT